MPRLVTLLLPFVLAGFAQDLAAQIRLDAGSNYALYAVNDGGSVLFGSINMDGASNAAGDYQYSTGATETAGWPTSNKSITTTSQTYQVGDASDNLEVEFYEDGTWKLFNTGTSPRTLISTGTYVEYFGMPN